MNRISLTRLSVPGLVFLVLTVFGSGTAAAEPPLQRLARSHFDAKQGVVVAAEDGTILAALNPDRAFHPASVTKVASTLAFLRHWGPNRRMRTKIRVQGPVVNDELSGEILVQSEGDPYFVFENAFLVLLELNRLGIRRVRGDVRVEGPFFFNWKPDPRGRRFKQALSGRAGMAGWRTVEAHSDTKKVELEDVALQFTAGKGGSDRDRETSLLHESAPLVRLLKEFNGYSNNIFHIFTQQIGGTDVVEKIARGAVPERSRSRVRIDNGAGGGRINRLSPRATVAILQALAQELASHGLTLTAVLPVAGVDAGTLESRLETPDRRGAVVGKTGTLPSIGVSALAGVAHTRRYGRVYFAILNQGVPIWKARKQQDAFVSALLEHAGPAPPVYRPPRAPAFTEARIR